MFKTSLFSFFALVALSSALATTPRSHSSLIKSYYDVYALQDPAGSYAGDKSVLGVSVHATIKIEGGGKLQFTVKGPVEIDCDGEEYTYSNGQINFPNIGTQGDCLHDTLATYGAQLKQTTYDSASDTIQVQVKYSIVTIKIDLTHQGLVVLPVIEPPTSYTPSLAELIDSYYEVFASHNPTGMYTGSKSVFGSEVDASISVSASTFSLTVSGAGSVNCPNEPYTYSNGVIDATNAQKTGDCIHNQLQNYGIALHQITYDAPADAITVHLTVEGVLPVSFTVNHQAMHHRSVADHTPFGDLIDRYYDLYAGRDPAGTYEGKKSVFGQQVDAVIQIEDSTHFHFTITGITPVDCDNVKYTYSDGVFQLPEVNVPGTCIHDQFQKAGITYQSATYNTAADSILVKVKYSILTLSLELDHKSGYVAITAELEDPTPLPQLIEAFMADHVEAGPSGTYKGSKSILGQTVYCTSVVGSSTFDISFSGMLSANCVNEDYTYSNGVISVTHLNDQSDCIHQAMQRESVQLESITFDEGANQITATIKKSFLTVRLVLSHQ